MKPILFALWVSTLPAFANLGQSDHDCVYDAHYGVPLVSDIMSGRAMQYAFNPVGLNIIVTYLDNKSVTEVYLKQDPGNFTRKQVDKLLAKNADSHGWKGPVENADGLLWVGWNNRTGFWNRGNTVTVKADGSELAYKILHDAGVLKPIDF